MEEFYRFRGTEGQFLLLFVGALAWDPLTLSSTSLDNPQHLVHMVNKLRNKIYKLQANISDPINFENMLTKSTLILIALQLSSG
jgi:hypothetical protein